MSKTKHTQGELKCDKEIGHLFCIDGVPLAIGVRNPNVAVRATVWTGEQANHHDGSRSESSEGGHLYPRLGDVWLHANGLTNHGQQYTKKSDTKGVRSLPGSPSLRETSNGAGRCSRRTSSSDVVTEQPWRLLEPRKAAKMLRTTAKIIAAVAKRISSNLLPGDIVEVFSDPITKHNSEGFAKLIERHKVTDAVWNGMPIETWLVRFDGDRDEGSEVLQSIWNGEAE